MIKINEIYETKKVIDFLTDRQLLLQYDKAKNNILKWYNSWTLLKIMNPKNKWIYSFRINKQFRAFCRIKNTGKFVVYKISNHQNF